MNLAVATSAAQLPRSYEAARSALAQCQAIDECKEWADKAAALASYAKQADDEELEKMAARIRARAMRRAGELAKQMMQPQGRPNKDDGTVMFSKDQVQEVSGFSERQLNTSLRIASVPERQFAEQIESANPPTLTELARQGTQKREIPPAPETWLKGRDAQTFNAILHMIGTIEEYAGDADTWPVPRLVEAMTTEERARVRKFIGLIDAVHDQIITRI